MPLHWGRKGKRNHGMPFRPCPKPHVRLRVCLTLPHFVSTPLRVRWKPCARTAVFSRRISTVGKAGSYSKPHAKRVLSVSVPNVRAPARGAPCRRNTGDERIWISKRRDFRLKGSVRRGFSPVGGFIAFSIQKRDTEPPTIVLFLMLKKPVIAMDC